MEYLTNKSIVGTHYYKVMDNGITIHVNHMDDDHYLINMLDDDDMDIMRNPQDYDIFEDGPEMKLVKTTEEVFEEAIRKAIFELGIFEYVKSK